MLHFFCRVDFPSRNTVLVLPFKLNLCFVIVSIPNMQGSGVASVIMKSLYNVSSSCIIAIFVKQSHVLGSKRFIINGADLY